MALDIRQIKQFFTIGGVFRSPEVTEHGKKPKWNNTTGVFDYEDDVKLQSAVRETATNRIELTNSDGSKVFGALGALAWLDTLTGYVTSVFGRTGDVTAQTGDYTAAQVTNAFDVTADTLDDIADGVTNIHFHAADKVNLDLNTAARHTHSNKAILDGITTLGSGKIITDYERSLLYAHAGNDAEFIRDTVADFVQDGTGISWVHNDPANTLTPEVTLAPFTTDNLTEGASNLYYGDDKARAAISVVETHTGMSSLTYDEASGVISFDPVAVGDVRATLSATYPIKYNAGTGNISLDDSFVLDPAESNIIEVSQSLHGFTENDAIRLDPDTQLWVKSLADADTHSSVDGVVVDVLSANVFTYQHDGILARNPNPFDLGVPYFLSNVTAGEITTEPTYSVGEVRQYIGTGVESGLLLEIDMGDVLYGLELDGYPTGTVEEISAGNGMDFGTITVSGDVVLGTPSSVSSSSINEVTATSHTHALAASGVVAGTYNVLKATVNSKGIITSAEEATVASGVTATDDSVQGDGSVGNPVTLVNDEGAPDPLTYYGTDISGVKGYHILPVGGSVLNVMAGAGMDFMDIEVSGEVVMGTPSNITSSSINEVTTTSHTHALDNTGVVAGTYSFPSMVVDAKGRITSIVDGAVLVIGDWVDDREFGFADVTAGTDHTYDLDMNASYDYQIESFVAKVDTGTLTDVTVYKNAVAITDFESLTITGTKATFTAVTPIVVFAGDEITMSIGTAYTGVPTYIGGKINTRRIIYS